MKKFFAAGLLAILSVFCFAGCNNGNTEEPGNTENPPEEVTEQTYECKFNKDETVKGNGYQDAFVDYLARDFEFYQIDTLLLKSDGNYSLRKRLTTENNGVNVAGIDIYFDFVGTYEGNGNDKLLKRPSSAEGSVSWGTQNRGYEEGTISSTQREGILWYFSTGFIGQKAGYVDMTVTVTEDSKFTFAVSGLESSQQDGNSDEYALDKVNKLTNPALENKTIYWLGSSVTYGSASGQVTMADYIQKRHGATCVKEAVSGTTLYKTSDSPRSYPERLEKGSVFDKNAKVDAFVCQISTNDINKYNRVNRLGVVTANDKRELTDFDVTTSLGAVEYIICYVKQTWNCPVIFYSGTSFGGETGYYYDKLINGVKQAAEKWEVDVLDLFHDSTMTVTPEQYDFYMSDPIHPKKAGYLQWWTPKFEEAITKALNKD